METQLSRIIHLKESDIKIQVVTGLIAIVLAPFTWFTSLFLLGIAHSISTFYWLFKSDMPRTLSRKIIEPINVVVIIIFLGGIILDNCLHHSGDISMYLVIGLLCIGPILGILYFVTTKDEIAFYKKMLQSSPEEL